MPIYQGSGKTFSWEKGSQGKKKFNSPCSREALGISDISVSGQRKCVPKDSWVKAAGEFWKIQEILRL